MGTPRAVRRSIARASVGGPGATRRTREAGLRGPSNTLTCAWDGRWGDSRKVWRTGTGVAVLQEAQHLQTRLSYLTVMAAAHVCTRAVTSF